MSYGWRACSYQVIRDSICPPIPFDSATATIVHAVSFSVWVSVCVCVCPPLLQPTAPELWIPTDSISCPAWWNTHKTTQQLQVCVCASETSWPCVWFFSLTSVINLSESVHLYLPISNIAWRSEQNTGGFSSLTHSENHALVPSELISLPLLFFVCWVKWIHRQRG